MYPFSKRERYLIAVLVFLLVITGFWKGLLQSEVEEHMDIKEALEQEIKRKQEMEAVFEEMKSRDAKMEQLKEEFLGLSGRYYPWMSGHEAGRELVSALDKSNLRSDSMKIGEPRPFSEGSLLYIIEIHGLAAGTKEEILCFLEWMFQNKSASFAGFRVTPQKEGDYRMEYDVEFYMTGEETARWRN